MANIIAIMDSIARDIQTIADAAMDYNAKLDSIAEMYGTGAIAESAKNVETDSYTGKVKRLCDAVESNIDKLIDAGESINGGSPADLEVVNAAAALSVMDDPALDFVFALVEKYRGNNAVLRTLASATKNTTAKIAIENGCYDADKMRTAIRNMERARTQSTTSNIYSIVRARELVREFAVQHGIVWNDAESESYQNFRIHGIRASMHLD